MSASLALILHAHLPFVRHPEHVSFHEERWLFEAITETYVPLVRMMQRLQSEGVPFKLTMSVTATLCTMLNDCVLRARYITHLDQIIQLADQQFKRAAPGVRPLARFYHDLFSETKRVFVEDWNCDLLSALRRLHSTGDLELIASAATHGILPILMQMPRAAEVQVAIGCEDFQRTFHFAPRGFWLPECAYSPGLEKLLAIQNVRWFILDAHGLEQAQPPAKLGTFAPCFTPAGPAAFARDSRGSEQVWSAESGYPGDAAYRDFYRDIGFELRAEELAGLPGAKDTFTGIKYYRVTGRNIEKQLYAPDIAVSKAQEHARDFVRQCIARVQGFEFEAPILTIPLDAELFGHWWFEGPVFLEQVIREAAANELLLTTPTEYLASYSTLQIVQPAPSTWGDKGFLDVWLDDKCAWIYPHLHAANARMLSISGRAEHCATSRHQRALRQLGRELLLAQGSDWPFLIRNGTAQEYAAQRLRDHLARFTSIADSIEKDCPDNEFLTQCEERDNIFPDLNWRHYAVS